MSQVGLSQVGRWVTSSGHIFLSFVAECNDTNYDIVSIQNRSLAAVETLYSHPRWTRSRSWCESIVGVRRGH